MGNTLPVEPPTRKKRVGGIRNIAEFRPNTRLGGNDSLVFQSEGCALPNTEVDRCIAEAPVPDKSFTGILVEDGATAPFTIYAGVACWAGPDPDELARAEAALEAGKDRAIEEVYGEWAQDGTALAAGETIAEAIALVDNELDAKYLGLGVIVMNRGDAVLARAAGALEESGADGVLHTANGTPVLSSGMVAAGAVSGTGAIAVEHTPSVIAREVIDPTANMHYAIAEQMHAIVVDCEFRVTSTFA